MILQSRPGYNRLTLIHDCNTDLVYDYFKNKKETNMQKVF